MVSETDDSVCRIRLEGHEGGDGDGELLRSAGIVHVGRGDSLHPRVDVQNRPDLRVRLVDHPMLDRVDRDATGLDPGRDAQDDDASFVVEVFY